MYKKGGVILKEVYIIKSEESEEVRLFLKSMTQSDIQMPKAIWSKWLNVLHNRSDIQIPFIFVTGDVAGRFDVSSKSMHYMNVKADFPVLNVWLIDSEKHSVVEWLQGERGL